MSSLFRPRRWPYDPNDPNQDQQDQGMYAPGPELGPAGGPPPPTPTPVNRPAAAEASMFQPNPTGPMPSQESLQGDAMQNATKSLYAPAQPDQAAPSPDRQAYSKPLERPEPPERIPYQKYNPFSLGHANAYAKQAVDAENAHNDHIYQLRLTAYEAEQRRLIEATYARNAGLNAPLESQLAYLARPDTPGTPEAKAWAQEQLSQTRKMNAPTPKEPTAFEIWREQNPQAPVSEWFKIQPAVQSTTIRTDNPREPNPPSTPLTIDTVDGPVQGSFKGGTYYDAANRPIPPEKLKGAAKLGSGGTPGDIETLAQSLAAGDLTRIKDVTSMRNDTRTRLYARIKQINPSYNTADVDRKIAAMSDVTNGKSGMNIQSLGTFLEHAGELVDVAKTISQTGSPALNRPINWWRQNMSGDPQFQRLLTAIEPVGKEFESFLLNNRALYTQDRQDINNLLSGNQSIPQMLATVNQMGRTVNARYNEMNAKFKRTMGGKTNLHDAFPEMFSPEAATAAQKIGISVAGESGKYKYTATGANGEKVGSNDGKSWTPIK